MASKPFIPTPRDLPVTLPRRLADAVLNLIFPESCIICSAPVSRQQDAGVCERCWQRTLQLRIREPWCVSCGLPFSSFGSAEPHLCSDCILHPPPYSGARSFGYYSAELSRIIQHLKFRRRQNLAGLLAPLLASTFFDCWNRGEFDIIVPVPLHPKRRHERGFNQAALLGRGLTRQLALPVLEKALIRVRHTTPQVNLTDAARWTNVRQAFQCRLWEKVSGQRVLLVDDVMTTGATAASAAEALLSGGSRSVSVLTVARAVPGI